MHPIGGGSLSIVIALVFIYFLVKYLRGNWASITHQNDTPMEKAKRAWSRAKQGTKEKADREFDLDLLVVEKINKATTLFMLYNAYEEGVTYTLFWGLLQKQRAITPFICTAYTKKKKYIQDEMVKEEKRRELARHSHSKDDRAPRPQRIDRRGKKDPGNVCYLSLIKKDAAK